MNELRSGKQFRGCVMTVAFVVWLVGAEVGSAPQASAQSPPKTQTGVVLSPDGKPLNLVWVQELGEWSGVLTGADGRFTYPSAKGATLLFVKDGFRPEVRVAAGQEADNALSIVMQAENQPPQRLPLCYRHRQDPLRELDLAGVRGVKVRRGRNADYTKYLAAYKYGISVMRLSSMSGMHVAGMTPTPEWATGLGSFTVRSLKCGDGQWFDLRGISTGGFESRWVGYAFAYVEYSKVPSAVARVFDKAIDNGCCR